MIKGVELQLTILARLLPSYEREVVLGNVLEIVVMSATGETR